MGEGAADRRVQRLVGATWLFAVGSTVHIADHLRRGQSSVSEELYLLGNVGLVLQVTIITLLFTRHPNGPRAAIAGGFALASGFLAAHWLPQWSALSDPVWEIETLRWFSYLASTMEIVGALAVALASLDLIRAGMLDRFAVASPPAHS